MDTLRRYVIPWLVVAVVIGVVVGLALGWQVFPVSWYDTDPSDLKTEHQVNYIIMTADSLAVNGDSNQAVRRIEAMLDEETTSQELADLVESVAIQSEQGGDAATALRVRRLALAAGLPSPVSVVVPIVPSTRPDHIMAPSRMFVTTGALLIFAIAVALVAWALIRLLRRRQEPEPEPDWLDTAPSDGQPDVPPITDVGEPDMLDRPANPLPLEPIAASPIDDDVDELLVEYQPPARPVSHVPETESVPSPVPAFLTPVTRRQEDEPSDAPWPGEEPEAVAFEDDDESYDDAEDDVYVEEEDLEPEPPSTEHAQESAVDRIEVAPETTRAEPPSYEDVPDRATAIAVPTEGLGVFEAEYRHGDDDYDASFAVESADDGFIGECGMSVAGLLDGEGAQRVHALEVWLFDKEDIATECSILVSEYAYAHEGMNAELLEKGELVVPEIELVFLIETTKLQMTVTIKELSYVPDAELPESAFDHLAIEMAVERAA